MGFKEFLGFNPETSNKNYPNFSFDRDIPANERLVERGKFVSLGREIIKPGDPDAHKFEGKES